MSVLNRSLLGVAVLAALGANAQAQEPPPPAPVDSGVVIEVADFIDAVGECVLPEVEGGPVVCPSLRAAVMFSNDNRDEAVFHTIYLEAGTYLLGIVGLDEAPEFFDPGDEGTAEWVARSDADAAIGDLDLTQSVHIIGAGPGQTVVRWITLPTYDGETGARIIDEDPATGDRVFHIQTTDQNVGQVVIEGLTVMGGEVGVVPNTDCAVVDNPYDLDVRAGENCEITQFRRMGGAIAVGMGAAIVEYEEEVHGGGGGGGNPDGGPFPGGKPGEEEGFVIGQVVLRNVVVADSWSGADGGGVYNIAPMVMENVWITGNIAAGGNGGGMYNEALLTMTNTTIGRFFDEATIASLLGEGVNEDLIQLDPEDQGYIRNAGNVGENGGGFFATGSPESEVTMRQSAINGNEAVGGGAIAARSGITVNLENVTVSGNVARDVAGGVNTNGTVNLVNSTVANNETEGDSPFGGAGLNSFGDGSFTMVNTLIAGNFQIRDEEEGEPEVILANCGCTGGGGCEGAFDSEGYNLEDADTCNLVNTNDQLNTDPLVGALAFNNAGLPGLTETHALLVGSPALNAALNDACPDFDQRGLARPQGADCDIGAYELAVSGGGGGGGGGGCTLGGRGVTDPLLPGLVLLALAWLGLRRRSNAGK